MMKNRLLIAIMTLMLLPSWIFAQDEDVIRRHGITQQTVYEYFVEEGFPDPLVEEIKRYDEQGNVIEHKEINKMGEVRGWQTFQYDKNGDKVEEVTLDSNGDQEERLEWIYEDRLVVEKRYYDHKDRLVKRKEYKYDRVSE